MKSGCYSTYQNGGGWRSGIEIRGTGDISRKGKLWQSRLLHFDITQRFFFLFVLNNMQNAKSVSEESF